MCDNFLRQKSEVFNAVPMPCIVYYLTNGYDTSTAISSNHNKLFGRRVKAASTHDGGKGFSLCLAEHVTLGIERLHTSWLVHGSRDKNVERRMPLSHKSS